MSLHSILAVATGAPDDEAAVAIAADLASRHAARVVVINAFANAAPMVATALAGAPSIAVWRTIVDEEDEVRGEIASIAATQGKRYGLAISGSAPGPSIRVAPRATTAWAGLMRELPLADITVVAQSAAAGFGTWTGPLGEALMEAKSPVFVARDDASPAGKPAAIAWDGSFEAARAVRAALPLLKDAAKVAVLQGPSEIDVGKGARADPERLVDYLAGHGVGVAATLEAEGPRIGAALLESATSFGAALLVAGAYGHSRLGEAIFGGATRTMLEARDGPHLLISH